VLLTENVTTMTIILYWWWSCGWGWRTED